MSDPKHSPIPWTLSPACPTIILYVAECKTIADARLIVRAVNSFEELREALAQVQVKCHEHLPYGLSKMIDRVLKNSSISQSDEH